MCVAGAGVSGTSADGPGGFCSVAAGKDPDGGSSLEVLAATVSTSPPSLALVFPVHRPMGQLWPRPGTPLFATPESGSPDHPVDVDAARLQASADIEGEALDSEAMTEEEMQNFWNTQTHLNYVTAKAKPYEECCKILDLDPDFPAIAMGNPVRRSAAEMAVFHERRAQQMSPKAKKANPHCTDGDVRLYPWQVQAIDWLIEMEDSKLRAAILADDMGLGKTITALLLQTRARYPPAVSRIISPLPTPLTLTVADNVPQPTLALVNEDPKPQAIDHLGEFLARKHRTTLLVCPSNAAAVSKNEIALHFPYLTRRYWFGSKTSGESEDRNLTLGASPAALYLFLRSLPEEPATYNTIVLTTYQTLRTRAMYIEVNSPSS